jgi:hypothetical protein
LANDDVKLEFCVELMAGVWQLAQPMALKSWRPFEIEDAPPGEVVDGAGGASSLMNIANATTSLGIEAFTANWSELLTVGEKFVVSSG